MYHKTSLTRFFTHWILGIIILLLPSCDEIPVGGMIGDGGLLSGQPCSAPCFWGIRLGETTKETAIQIIQRHGPIDYKQEGNFILYGDYLSFEYDASGIVQSIEFSPDLSISVQSLIANYGTPDAVEVAYTGLTPEHPYFNAGLFFDSTQTYVMLERQEIFPAYSLKPNTLITNVIYFSERSYADRKESSGHITNWIGYGAYQDPHAFQSH